MAVAACRPILASPMPGRARVSCASSMARTRSTSERSPGWNCGSERWSRAVHRSRRALRALLTMTEYFDAIYNPRHGEEPRGAGRLEPRRLKMQPWEAAELIDERADERLDTARLEPYLRRHLAKELAGADGPLTV